MPKGIMLVSIRYQYLISIMLQGMPEADSTNPFLFGAIAPGESFADRDRERAELTTDFRNGQDVVIIAPRRYGKSSLVSAVALELEREGMLIADVDLMTTPTKERFAAALAASIYANVASPLERAWEKAAAPFRSLRLQPAINLDPGTGALHFSFVAAHRPADVDTTIEQLLRMPAQLTDGRDRRAALVLDEFQEVVGIDPHLPRLMRAIFQRQPSLAHVYLGSKRHVMERIFNDRNEPFWRSAKSIELGLIPGGEFSAFVEARFQATGRRVDRETLAELLALTEGHPHATQELAYFLWEQTPPGGAASPRLLESALGEVLRAEHSHFSLLWEGASKIQRLVLLALAREAGHPQTKSYRDRHELPTVASVQKALRTLEQREVVAGERGAYRIVEPFLTEWLNRGGVRLRSTSF
jgi:hypothetical protein